MGWFIFDVTVVTVNYTNLSFSDLCFEQVEKNFECVIRPGVTLIG